MGGFFYLDANGLVCWADARVPTPAALDARVGAVVDRLVHGGDVTAISEITLLEVHSTIHKHALDSRLPQHDLPWADAAITDLMEWLATGDLQVLAVPPKVAEMAMVNIEQVSKLRQKLGTSLKIRAWDAAHIYQAARWAREIGERVTIVTADADVILVVTSEPAFSRYLDILNPNL